MRIVLCTGGFDPLHGGHIEYFTAAKQLGDMLIIGLNSDKWLTRKKGKPFLMFEERQKIISSLKMVDCVFGFNDDDESAVAAIKHVKEKFPWAKIVFANGGEKTAENILEINEPDVEFRFGVGGPRLNSSSLLLKEWESNQITEPWGWHRMLLNENQDYKVQEIVINPQQTLQYQKHNKRDEFWFILKGVCTLRSDYRGDLSSITLPANYDFRIQAGVWYQAVNTLDEPCHILKIQHNGICEDDDIEVR